MNIFEYAKKMEKDGEAYYRGLAEKTDDKGLEAIWKELADAEAKHFDVLVEMEKNENPVFAETDILKTSKNIFSHMPKEKKDPNFSIPQIEAYQKAQELEKKSQEFYEQKATEANQVEQKRIFLRIAEEEKKHYFLMENMIEFMERPSQWIEFAEWNHLDEY